MVSLQPTAVAALEPAWASLNDLRDAGDRFERFVHRQLDRLDHLRLELEARERSLNDLRQHLDQNRTDVDRQRQHIDAFRRTCEQSVELIQSEARRLAQLQETLSARAESLSEPSSAAGLTCNGEQQTWIAERSRLSAELATARRQNAELVGAALELATVRRELADARIELLRQNNRLAQANGHFEPSMRRQLDALRSEHTRLAEESRMQQHQLSEARTGQQKKWLDELARLRSVVERRLAADPTAAPWSMPQQHQENRESPLHSVLIELDQIHEQLQAATSQTDENVEMCAGGQR